jgi:hypothetical protein
MNRTETRAVSFPYIGRSTFAFRRPLLWPGLIVVAAVLNLRPDCHALPSFARQMDMQCIMCHGEFPLLNDFGRQFKLSGYTLSTGTSNLPPVAVMLQPSFTHTQASQPDGAAPRFGDNNNFALTQASFFYAGRLLGPYASNLLGENAAAFVNKLGIFSQVTYDGVAKAWSWDNTELRYANSTTTGGHAVSYGVYLNNNPTLQDLWNTTPAWGFLFSGSGLAPTPAAATLIDGGLAQQVGGLGAYAMIDNKFYFDVGAYKTLGASLQKSLGVDPTDETEVTNLAPYWRLAYTQPVGGASWEIGTFGLAADTHPGRDASAGTDRIVDFGFDSEIQKSVGAIDFAALVSEIYERQTWTASQALDLADNAKDSLSTFKATVDVLYDKTYGGAVQYFKTNGSTDATLYSGSEVGSPDSDGFIFQANYLPINKTTGPAAWPRSNVKLSLQYTLYNRFDGAKSNIDGLGRSAHGNNTLYLEAWMAF